MYFNDFSSVLYVPWMDTNYENVGPIKGNRVSDTTYGRQKWERIPKAERGKTYDEENDEVTIEWGKHQMVDAFCDVYHLFSLFFRVFSFFRYHIVFFKEF